MNTNDHIKNLPSFKKCNNLVNQYALALGRVQEKIFEEYGQTEEQKKFFDNDFFDTRNLNIRHKTFCDAFAKCHEHCEMPPIEEMIESWKALIANLKLIANLYITKEPQSVRMCQDLMKYIIGYCLIEAKYYEALACAWMLLRLTRFEDTSCWIICLIWVLRLEEWELLGKILEIERNIKRKWPMSEGYILCVDCIHLIYQFVSATSQELQCKMADQLHAKLEQILADDKLTFLYSQSKTLLRAALIMASRLPNANLEKYGDPLYQRELEMFLCMGVLRTYHPAYFRSTESSSIHKMQSESADNFMRFSSAYADYVEVSITYAWDLWDAGLVREAESICLTIWRNSMAFGDAYWALRPLCLLFHIKSSITLESNLLNQFAECIQSLITPQSSTGIIFQTPKNRTTRPSFFGLDLAMDDSPDYYKSVGMNLDELLAMEFSSITIGKDLDAQKQQIEIEEHISNCECTFCVRKAKNWTMQLEMAWLIFLFRQRTHFTFAHFHQTLNEIRDKRIQPLRECLLIEIFGDKKGIVKQKQPHQGTNSTATNVKTPTQVEIARDTPINTPMAPKKRGRPPRKKIEKPSAPSSPQLLIQQNSSEKENSHQKQIFATPSTSTEVNQEKMNLPPLFIHYLARSFCQICLIKPEEINMQFLDNTLKLCEQSSLLSYRCYWLLLRHLRRTTDCTSATAADQDFRNFGHLFYREWRWRCCHYLARSSHNTYQKSSSRLEKLLPAFYHIESTAVSMRQLTRIALRRKATIRNKIDADVGGDIAIPNNSDNTPDLHHQQNYSSDVFNNFFFKEPHDFCKLLPYDITFVNISMDENGVLWLCRLHPFHDEPIVLRLCQIGEKDPMLLRMQELLEANDESAKRSMLSTEDDQINDRELDGHEQEEIRRQRDFKKAKMFWDKRKQLDKDMGTFLSDLQSAWFSAAAPLLLPLNHGSDIIEELIRKLVDAGIFSQASATTFMHLMDRLDQHECQQLAECLQQNDPAFYRTKARPLSIRNLTKIRKLIQSGRDERNSRRHHTLLVVPPTLSHLPWECLPIFNRAPLVSRIPSLHFFQHLIDQSKMLPKPVDGRKSFYVLNPDGDLTDTQKRIAEFIDRFQWNGLTGQIPTKDQLQVALNQHDLFLYIGHGSGGRYFGRSTVRESNCRAVTLLMGCSSLRTVDEGLGFDGRSVIHEYLIAQCPCIIGCLWLVTDGEIDRFFIALMEYAFAELTQDRDLSNDKKSPLDKKNRATAKATTALKLLAEGMVQARLRCKLPYLTGASVIAYGLPIAAGIYADI